MIYDFGLGLHVDGIDLSALSCMEALCAITCKFQKSVFVSTTELFKLT